MQRKQMVDFLAYLLVRLLVCVVQAMPIDTAARAARWLGWLFCDVLKVRRRVVDDNLAHAYGELSDDQRHALARQMWEHLFLLVVEVAHTPRKLHETNWRRYVRLKDQDRIVRRLLSDRPTLIITAHFGNFEVGGYVLGLLGFPVWTVARTLDNPYLDRFVGQFRSSRGARIIPKVGGSQKIEQVLADGESMAFLADQYAGEKGCFVDFFGRPASAYKAIALLSLQNDAPMVVACTRRLGRPMRFEVDVSADIDPVTAESDVGSVRELTQWYTARLEEAIRLAPGQYWWVHRRWKDRRAERRRERAARRRAA